MQTTLSAASTAAVMTRLRDANLDIAARYPGERPDRQPVHTVYGGAQLFKSDSGPKLGALARRALSEYAPTAASLASALGLPTGPRMDTIYGRIVEKLRSEAVEDFRIDFEDGYGNRPDIEEDGHAQQAGIEVARGLKAGTLPPFIGIRIKPFTEELRERSARTLDLFVSSMVREGDGTMPDNFVVTLPKITTPAQPSALADLLELLESGLHLARGAIRLELMIETTQSILNDRGESNVQALVQASEGRCVAAHFGTYDYTASCSITAAHQHMLHPACDFARHVMQVALAGTGVWLADGATNVMPVGPHRATPGGPPLTTDQLDENRRTVHAAWKLHFDHIQHSLVNGYYQGWDLHPAQLPTRYAALYAFFLDGLNGAAQRLSNFVGKAAQATLIGEVFDDAATGQGLLNYFLRAMNCGAITEKDAVELSGLTIDELRSRSFVRIMNGRRG